MGKSHSKRKEKQNYQPKEAIQAKKDIELLLSNFTAENSLNGEFKIEKRTEINQQLLKASLEEMKDNETFKKYNTYHMIHAKMPMFTISKTKINETGYGPYPNYYDIYGRQTSDDKIKQILTLYISVDIVPTILEYLGHIYGEYLFTLKKMGEYAPTLTETEWFIGDMLMIHNTYSEKSGEDNYIKYTDKYDKQLVMYIGWIIHHLGTYNRWNIDIHCLGGGINFNFNEFMQYEIGGEIRPPKPPKETICIVGNCLVLMESGCKYAKDIRAGDIVRTLNGSLVKVLCTVTQIINDYIKVCKIGECYVTPKHPIRIIGDKSNKWNIPMNMDNIQCIEMYVNQINNFILESQHSVIVDNVECITLAHMSSDPVIKHHVWGTNIIITILKSIPSYPDVIIDDTTQIQSLFQQHKCNLEYN
eukprot:154037_1